MGEPGANPVYRLVKKPDGLTHVERNGCSIGYVFERPGGGLGCSLFDVEATPEKGFSKPALLAWVKRNDRLR